MLKRIKMPLLAAAALQGATASIVRTALSPNLLASMESFTDSAFEGTPCASFDLGEVTTSSDERYTGSLGEVDTIIIGECHAYRPLINDCVAFLAQALPQFNPDQYVMLIEQPVENPTPRFLSVNSFSDFCDQKKRMCHGWDVGDARLLTDQLVSDYKTFLVRGLLLQAVSEGDVSQSIMMKRIRSKKIREKVLKELEPFQIYLGRDDSLGEILDREISGWSEIGAKSKSRINFRQEFSFNFKLLQKRMPGMFEAHDYPAWLKDPRSHWIHSVTGEMSGFKKHFDWLAYKRNGDLISTVREREPAFVLTGAQHMYEGDEVPEEYKVAPSLYKNGAKFAYMQMDCEKARKEIEEAQAATEQTSSHFDL